MTNASRNANRRRTVTLKPYPSRIYPVSAVWNHGRASAVFENEKQARDAMIGRFGDVRFIDHLNR